MCVVGHEVWAELFGGPPARAAQAEALHMTADGHLWTVVGVLKDRPIIGSTDDTNIWNRKVLVPETTYDGLYSPAHATDRIYVRLDPLAAVRSPLAALRGIIDATLLRRHHGVKNFKIEDKDSHAQELLVLDIIKMLLLSTGVVALSIARNPTVASAGASGGIRAESTPSCTIVSSADSSHGEAPLFVLEGPSGRPPLPARPRYLTPATLPETFDARSSSRVEVAALVRRLGTTSVHVTHDQVEAMTTGDRIAVLRAGELQQVGPPRAIYEAPANTVVAGFLGTPAISILALERSGARYEGAALSLPATPGVALPYATRLPPGKLNLYQISMHRRGGLHSTACWARYPRAWAHRRQKRSVHLDSGKRS